MRKGVQRFPRRIDKLIRRFAFPLQHAAAAGGDLLPPALLTILTLAQVGLIASGLSNFPAFADETRPGNPMPVTRV
ncbi:hypothetical protein EFB14_19540 [Rhizobium fabae]|uniref:Uncharacterized protein n=1 Tax=Rhizobium fabae TaxID=573179 RepID=A0A7W6B5P6_9HYPH|nr:hypothetical protein [Rhizobium fabae]RUM11073.1 hypothetical protein EFB14_19540 [Rhizobium fabae]